MNNFLNVEDIAETLLIINRQTVDRLFYMQNCADCIALYMFYYKTAKWQKTNCIRAVDDYTKKCLNWGSDRLRKTKQILKSEGLIEVVQSRNSQNISGWYIKINYIVPTDIITQAAESLQEARTLESKNTRKQEHLKPTSRFQTTNALINTNNMLKEDNSQVKNKNINNKSKNNLTINSKNSKFDLFWENCPRKHNKEKSLQKYLYIVNSGIPEEILISKMKLYAEYVTVTNIDTKYICTPIGWLSAKKWEDAIEIPNQFSNNSQIDNTSDFDMW